MDQSSIFARVAGGLAVRGAAIVGALYGASYVWSYVANVFDGVSHVLR